MGAQEALPLGANADGLQRAYLDQVIDVAVADPQKPAGLAPVKQALAETEIGLKGCKIGVVR
jgi:hypothetical protein